MTEFATNSIVTNRKFSHICYESLIKESLTKYS